MYSGPGNFTSNNNTLIANKNPAFNTYTFVLVPFKSGCNPDGDHMTIDVTRTHSTFPLGVQNYGENLLAFASEISQREITVTFRENTFRDIPGCAHSPFIFKFVGQGTGLMENNVI